MSVGFELNVEGREQRGTNNSRRLRRAGKVPAVLYGGGQEPSPIVLDHANLLRQMEREAFYTSILTLKVGAEAHAVIVKDVQRHPARRQVLHMDFQRILEDEEITLNVPIHFLGEDVAKGVKEQGGEIAHLITDVEITCLPRNLPEYLELDVSALELNQLLHLSDIVLPEGVEFTARDQDPAVIAINPPRQEEEEEVLEAEEAEVPTVAEAEGEEAPAEEEEGASKEESSD